MRMLLYSMRYEKDTPAFTRAQVVKIKIAARPQLLDTNTCIYIIKRRLPKARR
jgi:hypothetical protein